MLEGLLARFGLNLVFGGIGNFLKRVPWQVWAAIGALLLIAGAVWFHQRAVHRLHDAAYAAGQSDEKAAWQAQLAKAQLAAKDWRAKYDAAAKDLSNKIGERNALEARNIAARADDLRLRGPGQAAACAGPGNGAGSSAGASGHDASGGPGDAAVAAMPAGEALAIVPWEPLVQFGEQHDLDRAEVLTWREWYAQQAKLLREAKTKLPTPIASPEGTQK